MSEASTKMRELAEKAGRLIQAREGNMSEISRETQEALDKLAAMIEKGAQVFSHPNTAALLKPVLPNVESCEWIEEGTLYAMDLESFRSGGEIEFLSTKFL